MRAPSLLLIALATPLVAQSPDLRLTAKLVVSTNLFDPHAIVEFQNVSDHTLNFPPPALLCRKFPGFMSLRSSFRPSDPSSKQSEIGIGCGICGVGSQQSMIEQAQTWIALPPGQSETFNVRLSDAIVVKDPGLYEFRIIYSAPALRDKDRTDLEDAGFTAPNEGEYRSNSLRYRITTRPSSDDLAGSGP